MTYTEYYKLKNEAYAHILHVDRGIMLARKTLSFVPRVGDEIRLAEDKYYKVTLVVWVYDEPDRPYQRVNIGVEDVN